MPRDGIGSDGLFRRKDNRSALVEKSSLSAIHPYFLHLRSGRTSLVSALTPSHCFNPSADYVARLVAHDDQIYAPKEIMMDNRYANSSPMEVGAPERSFPTVDCFLSTKSILFPPMKSQRP